MKKSKTILLLRLLMVLLCFSYNNINAQDVTGSWSGTVILHETVTHVLGHSERQITIFFTNNVGTGTVKEDGEYIVEGKLFCKSSCSGYGNAELHEVTIDREAATYRIHVISPRYTCTNTGQYCEQPTTEMQELDIIVSERPIDNNPDVLQGSETRTNDLAANGKVTTTISWNLVRSDDVELIVTPQNYDIWLPEPGKDELTKGSLISISLKLLGRNGQPPALKAKSFELTLSNTSEEPGITLNAPLVIPGTLPDLRFLPQTNAAISADFQFVQINCFNGVSGDISIGAFDGGGWTTLTAIAILEDDTQIQGSLLVSGGEKEIPVPKRNPGTKIASFWLVANRNPGEMDDKETSAGNTNNGDGLTAYEEYRGVISEGKFLRLDPNKKELGVKIKKAELSYFSEGITRFENASGLKVIRFYETEIGLNRRLNNNASSAHDYDQYVLYLLKGTLPANLIGEAIGSPGIPSQFDRIVVDANSVNYRYDTDQAFAKRNNTTLSYTIKDLLATVIAHELGHGVNVSHHGSLPSNSVDLTITASKTGVRIFDYKGTEILTRPYHIVGRAGEKGNEQSGDVNCFMLNNSLCDWAVKTVPDSMYFYEVPIIPLGTKLCNKKDGTGLNLKNANGNNNYFGDATYGNCLSQIKLK